MQGNQIEASNFSISHRGWIALAGLAGAFTLIYFDIIEILVGNWMGSEEYSHGLLIPFISGFLIWQKSKELAPYDFEGSWAGIGLLLAGVALYVLGELASLQILLEYSLLVVLMGTVWAYVGSKIFRQIWLPLFFLFFAIPLPNFLYQGLSSKLQLISSQLGVSLIRFCDISVYQEGNVIDLGAMQLQVVEACSGLRYLFPLMSLAFMCAYFYQAQLWKRAVIFLSSIPVTILMNSFRIGIIGVTVEYFGKEAAEGFLHDFEGWIVFMACTGILIGEMWVLAQLGKDPRPLMTVFGLTIPEPWPAGTSFRERKLPRQFWVAGFVLLGAFVVAQLLGQRQEIEPSRANFAGFPMHLGEWTGRRQTMEQQYIDRLKFEDYILADYVKVPQSKALQRQGGTVIVAPVNFYSAYYASQRQGESIHSPRSCIPGGGWEIRDHEVMALTDVSWGGQPMKLNRLLIQKGEDRQLVYYWFQQRGRDLTNEYVIKWYLFWDALTMNRTDGALVRLTTLAPKGEDIAAADARLQDFLKVSLPELDKYIPR